MVLELFGSHGVHNNVFSFAFKRQCDMNIGLRTSKTGNKHEKVDQVEVVNKLPRLKTAECNEPHYQFSQAKFWEQCFV